jgi:hypothetical protein
MTKNLLTESEDQGCSSALKYFSYTPHTQSFPPHTHTPLNIVSYNVGGSWSNPQLQKHNENICKVSLVSEIQSVILLIPQWKRIVLFYV